MSIDMHAHWNPAALIDPFRARTTPPLIETNADGVEVLRSNRGAAPVSEIFDDVQTRLAEMDRQRVSTGVLSLFGAHQWIERLDAEESVPLTRIYNDHVSEICRANEGRFAAYASLPQADMDAAVAEFERAISLAGMIGAVVPGNAFLTRPDAEAYRPLLAAATEAQGLGEQPAVSWKGFGTTTILRLCTRMPALRILCRQLGVEALNVRG